MKTEKGKSALVIIFLAMILLPYPLWACAGRPGGTALNENRMLAEKPVFSLAEIRTLPEAYEAYINDHLPFRASMLRTYSETEYRLFHTSMSYLVIFGKDGWLFHRDRNDGDPVGVYRGLNIPSDEELAQIRENLVGVRDALAARGIEFVVFLPPGKERMYAEYMPDMYGAPAETYALQVITEDLQTNTDLRVVNPTKVLTEAKEALTGGELLYYKTDSHWNELGAYIATTLLLEELGISVPAYNSGEVNIEAFPATEEDMTNLVNLERVFSPGTAYRVTGYDRHNLECTGGDFNSELFYRAEGADARKLFFYHDSFGESMLDALCSQFDESVLVHRIAFSPELLDRYQPDVFVLEVGERGVAGGLRGFTVGE